MSCYVVQTQAGEERAASENLKFQGFDTYLPMGEENGKVSALFAGYLFIHLDVTQGDWSKINRTPKVKKIISFGGLPRPLEDREYEAIRRLEQGKNLVKLPSRFQPGDPVKISSGVFRLQEGLVLRAAGPKIRVKLTFMGQDHEFEYDAEDLYICTA